MCHGACMNWYLDIPYRLFPSGVLSYNCRTAPFWVRQMCETVLFLLRMLMGSLKQTSGARCKVWALLSSCHAWSWLTLKFRWRGRLTSPSPETQWQGVECSVVVGSSNNVGSPLLLVLSHSMKGCLSLTTSLCHKDTPAARIRRWQESQVVASEGR